MTSARDPELAESGAVAVSAAIEEISSIYGQQRHTPFRGDGPVGDAFSRLTRALRATEAVSKRPNISVRASFGKGKWALVPWAALLDSRETDSTQHGLYVALLWREDLSGVYLTVMQGITAIRRLGARESRDLLAQELSAVRSLRGAELARAGFAFETPDLRSSGALAKGYARGTVASWFIDLDELPSAELLERTLDVALEAVEARITDRGAADPESIDSPPGDLGIAIYIPRTAERNLEFGLKRGVWGWKRPQADLQGLQEGNEVVFGVGYTGGSPRTTHENWSRHVFRRVVVARVTGTPYVDATPLWPDEDGTVSYPHRLPIEMVGEFKDQALSGADTMITPDLSAALKRSVSGGTAVPFRASTVAPAERPEGPPTVSLEAIGRSFVDAVEASGMGSGPHARTRAEAFIAAVVAKPFVVLSGLSGSGKTQLAMRLGEWFGTGSSGDRFLAIPVRPDWTGPEALLGYEDALRDTRGGRAAWFVPEALRFLLRASEDPAYPYLLLLDEMNLAHVERYFSDVLSGAESRLPTLPNLRKEADGEWRIVPHGPEKLPFPRNVVVVGTVNVDETTYLFSPKVLDRATTFEVRTSSQELVAGRAHLRTSGAANDADLRGLVRFIVDDGWHLSASNKEPLADALRQLHDLLSKTGNEFGHRLFNDALRFAAAFELVRPEADDDKVLDQIVMLKILPRINGARRRVEPLLTSIQTFALGSDGDAVRLPLTLDKVRRMLVAVETNQFVSFTE